MAKSSPDTIVRMGHGIRKEFKAGAAMRPGHIVSPDSSLDLQLASASPTSSTRMIVCEYDIKGKGIDDTYAANDNVLVEHLVPGQEVMVRAAAATAITRGTTYTTASGLLSSGSGIANFQALEASAAGSGDPKLVRCAVL